MTFEEKTTMFALGLQCIACIILGYSIAIETNDNCSPGKPENNILISPLPPYRPTPIMENSDVVSEIQFPPNYYKMKIMENGDLYLNKILMAAKCQPIIRETK